MWLTALPAISTPVWQGKRQVYLTSLVILGVLHALAILFVSGLVAEFFDSINALEKNTEYTLHNSFIQTALPMILMLPASIVIALLRWAERVSAEHLGQNYIVQVRLKLFRHLMFADLRAAQRFSHGAMALRFVTDLNGLRQWVALGLARLLVMVSTIIVVLVVLAWQQILLMSVVFLSLLIAVSLCTFIGSKLPRAIRSIRKFRARLAATVTDRINTATTVQAYNQEYREIRRVNRQSHSLYDATIKRAYIVGALYASLEATTVLTTALVLIAASQLVIEKHISSADIAAIMTLLGLLLTPLRDMGRIVDYWQQWKISNEKILRFLDSPRRNIKIGKKPSLEGTSTGQLSARKISIEGILKISDFEIKAGEHIFLEGKNGTGKTTLLFTLAGILPLNTGQIELDNTPLVSDHNIRVSQKNIALVSPDIGLMRGSLLRNLSYANTHINQTELDSIIRRCNLGDIIERLPRGLDSKLSEGGKNLSLGERKRIMLARALLMNPDLLLLDELDAHLDAHSFKIIEHTLSQFPGTIIEVSHQRKLNLQKSTRHWLLQEQKIHEYNT